MTKEQLIQKLAGYDAEAADLKTQIRWLQARLEEVERNRRGYLDQLERGDYGVA